MVTPKRKTGARRWESPVVGDKKKDLTDPKLLNVPSFPTLETKAVDQQWPDAKEEQEMLSTSKESLAPNWLRG
eukprot:4291930-Karenia_brevis.AAC.1